MSGAGNVDHVEIIFFDDPIQVYVDEVLSRRRAPVSKQHALHVHKGERLAQQRIVAQIHLTDREVVSRAPVGVHALQQFGCKRFHVFLSIF